MIDHPTEHVQPPPPSGRRQRSGRHGLMMIACCIPMLGIAILLVATGVVGAGFIFIAVGCTAMMAIMMRGMNHRDMNHDGPQSIDKKHAAPDHNSVHHTGTRPLPPPSNKTSNRPNDR